eukprot:317016_1
MASSKSASHHYFSTDYANIRSQLHFDTMHLIFLWVLSTYHIKTFSLQMTSFNSRKMVEFINHIIFLLKILRSDYFIMETWILIKKHYLYIDLQIYSSYNMYSYHKFIAVVIQCLWISKYMIQFNSDKQINDYGKRYRKKLFLSSSIMFIFRKIVRTLKRLFEYSKQLLTMRWELKNRNDIVNQKHL